jgi:hypothetical protein
MKFRVLNPSILPNRYLFAVIGVACILVSSCGGSSTTSLELAKQNVVQFHSQLNSEQYAVLYSASDEKLHQATSESDFVKLLEAIHRKLGTVQQSDLRNTGIAWFMGQGATVTLVYDTKFAEGNASEKFVWHIKDNKATLYGYNINSSELVTK